MGGAASAAECTDRSDSHSKLGLTWGAGEAQGWRPTMEDACVARCSDGQNSWGEVGIFGVFDGHGGAQVAKFCAEQWPQVVMKGDASNASAALYDSFLQVDDMLQGLGQEMSASDVGHPDNVGCTAVVSVISPDSIIVANAGDSRAVLSREGRAVALSKDHKPNLPKEAARIRKAGGFVSEKRLGPNEVLSRVNGKLAVSRAMGDLSFKKNTELSVTEQLVSCAPEVRTWRRQAEDEFMVIACDGVWDVLSSQQVVDRVHKDLNRIRRGEVESHEIVSKILDECRSPDASGINGKGTDNMTMILVVFDKRFDLPALRELTLQSLPELKAPLGLLENCLNPVAAPGQPDRIPRRSSSKERTSHRSGRSSSKESTASKPRSSSKESGASMTMPATRLASILASGPFAVH